jgi:hypothetical protein
MPTWTERKPTLPDESSVSDGVQVAISGVQNAPGTHAAVFSDAFLVVRDPF